jgi:co-chaperonin GroES (HSP10)
MTAAAEAHAQLRPAPKPLHDPARRVRPLHDRVLVRRKPHVRQVGSIVLVGGVSREDMMVSEVIAIGPQVTLRPWELRVGDYAMHPRVCGVKYDNVLGRLDNDAGDLVFLLERELIAIVDPDMVVTGASQFNEHGELDFSRK